MGMMKCYEESRMAVINELINVIASLVRISGFELAGTMTFKDISSDVVYSKVVSK